MYGLKFVRNLTWEVDQTIIVTNKTKQNKTTGVFDNFESLPSSQSPMSANFEIPHIWHRLTSEKTVAVCQIL